MKKLNEITQIKKKTNWKLNKQDKEEKGEIKIINWKLIN